MAGGSSADQGTLHLLPAPRTNHTNIYLHGSWIDDSVSTDKDVASKSTDDVRMRVVLHNEKYL